TGPYARQEPVRIVVLRADRAPRCPRHRRHHLAAVAVGAGDARTPHQPGFRARRDRRPLLALRGRRLDRHLHGRLPHPEVGAVPIDMADEATPVGTATETEAQESARPAPEEELPGTELERSEAGAPAPAAAQVPMLPGEVRPHPSPQRYVMIAAILVGATAAQVGPDYPQGAVPHRC